jgi:integrase-like protein
MSLRLVFRKSRSKGKRKTSAGSYYIVGTDHKGGRVHESLKTSDRTLAKFEFAKAVTATTEERINGSVYNFADAVLTYLGPKEAPRKPGNSNEAYLNEMMLHVGHMSLRDFTQATLDKLAKDMRPGCLPSTLKRHVYSPFIAMWNACAENEPPLCDHKKWKSPQIEKKRGDCPDDGYIQTLKESIDLKRRAGKRNNVVVGSRKPERDKALLLFMTFTGARSGAAQKLDLRNLSLDRGYATVLEKGKKVRQVKLTPETIEALRAQVAKLHEMHNGEAPPETLVFEVETRWGIPQLMKRLQKRARLPRWRPHAVGRHAAASRLLSTGKSTIEVRDAIGWDSTRMIDQYYGHLAQSHVDKVMEDQKLQPPAVKKDKSA